MANYFAFLKIGEEKYMKKLFLEGELFCKDINYFTKIDDKDLRGDKYDGAAIIQQASEIKLLHEGKLFATAPSGQFYARHPDDTGNIYCLYGIRSELIDLENKSNQPLLIDTSGLTFGDTAVIIFDIPEFLNRLEKAIKERGLQVQSSPVTYYDHKIYQGELTPFHKSIKYLTQNEFRIWIPNKMRSDLIINIGCMSDIGYLMPKSLVSTISAEPQ